MFSPLALEYTPLRSPSDFPLAIFLLMVDFWPVFMPQIKELPSNCFYLNVHKAVFHATCVTPHRVASLISKFWGICSLVSSHAQQGCLIQCTEKEQSQWQFWFPCLASGSQDGFHSQVSSLVNGNDMYLPSDSLVLEAAVCPVSIPPLWTQEELLISQPAQLFTYC